MSTKSQRIAARNIKNALKRLAHQHGMTNFRRDFASIGVVQYRARQGDWIRTFWAEGRTVHWY